MSQNLPFDENKFDQNAELDDFLNTPAGSDIGCFVPGDLSYPDNFKEETKKLPFLLKINYHLNLISVII